MLYNAFKYHLSANIGDEIQSLAAEQHLTRLDGRVDRDSLSRVFGPHKVVVIMNGWFTKFAHHWPPSSNVLPVSRLRGTCRGKLRRRIFGRHDTPGDSKPRRIFAPNSNI